MLPNLNDTDSVHTWHCIHLLIRLLWQAMFTMNVQTNVLRVYNGLFTFTDPVSDSDPDCDPIPVVGS